MPRATSKRTKGKPGKKTVSRRRPAKKPARGKTRRAAKKKITKNKAARKKAGKTSRKTSRKKAARAGRSVRAIQRMMQALGASSAAAVHMFHELEQLEAFIRRARTEISALRPDVVKEEHLPKAGQELEAIVQATADATHRIMDAVEIIERASGAASADVQTHLGDAVTRIYEACSFQDITGQRIGKVVKTLRDIEDRVDAMIRAFGGEIKKIEAQQVRQQETAAKQKTVTDADLLEGPQLAGRGKSQAEIDALLASFD